MADKIKILEDLSTLTKMCHAKSDGTSLKIEEKEIKNKIENLRNEIEEIKMSSAEDNYDASAEMADRNIEIITKKVILAKKAELKYHNSVLDELKLIEEEKSNDIYNLKTTKKGYEKYIESMKERISNASDDEIETRYNSLISETTEKINNIDLSLVSLEEEFKDVQEKIQKLSEIITNIEEGIVRKEEQLLESQKNLENKEVYIDKTKAAKTEKKIKELEAKVQEHITRLEEIERDPKYLEALIKEILNNNEDPFNARKYIIDLLTICSEIPYMNEELDEDLEEELTTAIKERDEFAAIVDEKTYDVLNASNPEQIRIDFLNLRIDAWNEELNKLEEKICKIDKDSQFNYQDKIANVDEMIDKLKEELEEYRKAYENEPESNISSKATLRVAFNEKSDDVNSAIEIATKLRQDEASDIGMASHIIKVEKENILNKIKEAELEIESIKERLMSKKSGMIDIGTQNKDREKLKELAKVVMDIKHRKQFEDTPITIASRLEEELNIDLVTAAFSNTLNVGKTKKTKKKTEETNSFTLSIEKDEKNGNSVNEIYTDIKEIEPVIVDEPRGFKVVEQTDIETNTIDEEPKEKEVIDISKKDLEEELNNFIGSLNI